MILWDVNLWVCAFRVDSPLHGPAFREIDAGSRAAEPFLFCPYVAASFLRLVTNPRIFVEPSLAAEAWQFADVLESRPSSVRVDLDAMAWGVFKHVCLVSRSVGNSVPDALLAALAIRHDATMVSADRGFGRYEGLRCRFIAGCEATASRQPEGVHGAGEGPVAAEPPEAPLAASAGGQSPFVPAFPAEAAFPAPPAPCLPECMRAMYR